jgi:hypothetical protein
MPTWIEALREFNSSRESWCVPKKGTPEHAEVMGLMGSPAKDSKKMAPKVRAPKATAEATEAPKKQRKVRSDKGKKRVGKAMVECAEKPKEEPVAKPAKRVLKLKKTMPAPEQPMMALMDKAPRRVLKLKKQTPNEELDM